MAEIFTHMIRTPFGVKSQAISFRQKAMPNNKGDYDVVEYIRVVNPGDTPIEVVVDDTHRQRYAEAYDAWKSGREHLVKGTPLDESGAFEPEVTMTLQGEGFVTLEQVSEATDGYCKTARMREWRERARKLIDTKKSASLVSRLESEIAVAKEELEELRAELRELREQSGASKEQLGAKANIATRKQRIVK
jgi:transposase-like protein